MSLSTNNQYLTTIASNMGLHPKSLHQLKAQRLARGAAWPNPSVVLPDGKELYHEPRFRAWYEREVAPHWSSKGETA
jgi:hypothetical protein